MKIYFVRHGHPDYKNDCLTELGHKQAAAAAERIRNCGIEAIYTSTKGRAMQTAEHTATVLGLDIIPCDFMREINWKSIDDEPILANGHPWEAARLLSAEGISIANADWRSAEPFCKSKILSDSKTVIDGVDAWLLELGYKREGEYYRVVGDKTDRIVAMFSHGGSSSVALSHILNIPLPQFCGMVHLDFASITVLEFSNTKGELFYPRFSLLNDARHIEGLDGAKIYGI